jgi:energy-converting hydrogenase Eha subunit B
MRRTAAAFAALLAILLQAFVIQAHVDGLGGLPSRAGVERAASGAGSATAQAAHLSGNSQSACVICQTLAAAGAALLSKGPVLSAASGPAANVTRVAIRYVPVTPAHAWQSRAPPLAAS